VAVRIKECKLGRLGRIGFVFRILQQQPEYEERRSSCAEQGEFTLLSSSNPSTRISATFSIAFKAFFIFHFSVISAKMANAMDADQ
jgi:hypothetical protein